MLTGVEITVLDTRVITMVCLAVLALSLVILAALMVMMFRMMLIVEKSFMRLNEQPAPHAAAQIAAPTGAQAAPYAVPAQPSPSPAGYDSGFDEELAVIITAVHEHFEMETGEKGIIKSIVSI